MEQDLKCLYFCLLYNLLNIFILQLSTGWEMLIYDT